MHFFKSKEVANRNLQQRKIFLEFEYRGSCVAGSVRELVAPVHGGTAAGARHQTRDRGEGRQPCKFSDVVNGSAVVECVAA